MPWKSKPKYSAPSPSISTYSSDSQRLRVKHIVIALFYVAILLGVCGAIPLLILFTPKPELQPWYPKAVKCATCADIEAQNPVLLEAVGCRGLQNHNGTATVMLGGMERCWVRERGKDGWLRPMGATREDMVRWEEGQKRGEGGE